LLPHEGQGFGAFYRLSKDFAPDLVRITGYGVDETPPGTTGGENSDSRTLQTDCGVLLWEVEDGASDVYFEYMADTEGAASGSPIIWEGTSVSLGIHEAGGCIEGPLPVGNKGTSFENDTLEFALQNYSGPNRIYVDGGAPSLIEQGTVLRPFKTVAAAAGFVPTGGTLSIVNGVYSEAVTLSTAMTIATPVGPVIIGE
jgi:hypothetical protein